MSLRILGLKRLGAPVLALAWLSCTQAETETPVPVAGTVSLVQVADLTAEEIDELPSSIWPAVQAGGWTRTDRGLERSKVLTPAFLRENDVTTLTLRINGAPIRWSDDGRYEADVPLGPGGELEVNVEYNGKVRKLDFIKGAAVGVSGGDTDIQILWYKLREPSHGDHGEHAEEHEGEHEHDGEHVEAADGVAVNAQALHTSGYACRDYNGPYGDCKNYHSGSKVYSNFVGSDCEAAWARFGLCWMDFMTDEGVDAYCTTTRNCSAKIGHSYKHHCH